MAPKIFVPRTVDFSEENAPRDFNAENIRVVDWRGLKEIDAEKLAELVAFGGPFALYLDGSGADDSTLERLRGADLRAITLQNCQKITAVGLAYLSGRPRLGALALGAGGVFKPFVGVDVPAYRTWPRIGDAGIEALAALSSLTNLTLIDCDGISEDGWRFLRTLPRLTEFDVDSFGRLFWGGVGFWTICALIEIGASR